MGRVAARRRGLPLPGGRVARRAPGARARRPRRGPGRAGARARDLPRRHDPGDRRRAASARPRRLPRARRARTRRSSTSTTPADGSTARSGRPHRRREALRHRQRVLRARDDDRGRPEPARAGALCGGRRGRPAAHRRPGVRAVPAGTSWPRYDARAVVPLTDLDLEVLAASDLPAFVPSAAVARATYDKYETHGLLLGHGLPSPPTCLPEEEPESYPVMVKPRQGSGARSIHPAADREEKDFFVRYVEGAGDGPAAHGRPRVLDGHPRRPRRALPQRDPADDDRVARGRVDQGHGHRRPGADRPRPRRRRGAGRARAVHRAGLPRPRDRPRHHRRQHALRRRVRGADVRRPRRKDLSRADRPDGVGRAGRAARRRLPGRRHVHALVLADRARPRPEADGPGHPPERLPAPRLANEGPGVA